MTSGNLVSRQLGAGIQDTGVGILGILHVEATGRADAVSFPILRHLAGGKCAAVPVVAGIDVAADVAQPLVRVANEAFLAVAVLKLIVVIGRYAGRICSAVITGESRL